MKTKPLLTLVSVAVAAFFLGSYLSSAPKPAAPNSQSYQSAPPTNPESHPTRWPILDPSNPTLFAQALRQMGSPEEHIQYIVIGAQNQISAREILARLAEIALPGEVSREDPKLAAIRSNRAANLLAVFGDQILKTDALIGLPYKDTFVKNSADPARDLLLASLIKKRDTQISQIHARSRWFKTNEDNAEIDRVKKDFEAELQRALTPDEFQAYQVAQFKDSDLGSLLTERFRATDAEIPALIDHLRAREKLPTGGPELETIQQQMQAKLEAAIGYERAQAFMVYYDPAYREMVGFTHRFDLPNDVAYQIALLKNDTLRARFGIMNPRTDPIEAMRASRAATETFHARFVALVGDEAAQAYIRDAKDSGWLGR